MVEVAAGVWWQRDECVRVRVREVILRRMSVGQNRKGRCGQVLFQLGEGFLAFFGPKKTIVLHEALEIRIPLIATGDDFLRQVHRVCQK